MLSKAYKAIAIEAIVFAATLFLAAGTVRWPAAWVFLILFFVPSVVLTRMTARLDPGLLAERMKSPLQKGQPLWDKIWLPSMLILTYVWLIVMGLDAVRFRWSVVPLWLQAIGGAMFPLSFWAWWLSFRENTFAAAVVRVQSERGHKVVSTGPYAVVRHPVYAIALWTLPAWALLLGSWAGFAWAMMLDAMIVFRTAMEDRELRRRLDGYPEYAARVRYRLVPMIW